VDNNKIKVFITGGTGFIGKHLVKQLIQRNYYCRCLVRRNSNLNELKDIGADLIYGDILDRGSIQGCLDDINTVYHLAAMGHVSAISEEAYQRFKSVNIKGTMNLAEECLKYQISKFVHFSSTAAMGLIKEPIVDERTRCQPATPYQKSKYDSENMILSYWEKYKLPVVTLRPSMVYGPCGQGEFLKWCRLIKKGFFPRIGRGKNLTPMVHVDDVVQAAIRVREKGIPGETYLITSDGSFELDIIRDIIIKELGIKRMYPYVPITLAKIGAWGIELLAKIFKFTPIVTYRNIDSTVTDRVFSISKAKEQLGYYPKTSLKDGIRQTLSWYIEKGYL
jgi:nucleoside-diphosphate-sugar epimerase